VAEAVGNSLPPLLVLLPRVAQAGHKREDTQIKFMTLLQRLCLTFADGISRTATAAASAGTSGAFLSGVGLSEGLGTLIDAYIGPTAVNTKNTTSKVRAEGWLRGKGGGR